MPVHEGQELPVARPDRDHEAGAVGQLLAERIGIGRCGGGHDDPVPRRPGRIAETAVGLADVDHAGELESGASCARGPAR